MPNQMTCPCCDTLDLRIKLVISPCVVCEGTRSVDAEKLAAFMKLADKLYHETQIPHQYFEIGNLFLRNISLTQEPDRYQVFAIYRKQTDGGLVQIDTLTVNASNPKSVCAALLRFDIESIDHFEEEIRIYDDAVSAVELLEYKKRFLNFAAVY